MNTAKRTQIFTRLREQNPNPTTELNYTTPFELLIAVILSAQATDVSVNKAIGPLFEKANTPKAIYDLGVENLKDYIKTIGLFNTKAANVIKNLSNTSRRVRRCGAAGKIRSGGATGRRPQDSQRCPQYCIWSPNDGCRHAYLPRIQPHKTGHWRQRNAS